MTDDIRPSQQPKYLTGFCKRVIFDEGTTTDDIKPLARSKHPTGFCIIAFTGMDVTDAVTKILDIPDNGNNHVKEVKRASTRISQKNVHTEPKVIEVPVTKTKSMEIEKTNEPVEIVARSPKNRIRKESSDSNITINSESDTEVQIVSILNSEDTSFSIRDSNDSIEKMDVSKESEKEKGKKDVNRKEITDDNIVFAAKKMIREGDLDTLTFRNVYDSLKKYFESKLSSKKKFIKKTVKNLVNKKVEGLLEPEEEEKEKEEVTFNNDIYDKDDEEEEPPIKIVKKGEKRKREDKIYSVDDMCDISDGEYKPKEVPKVDITDSDFEAMEMNDSQTSEPKRNVLENSNEFQSIDLQMVVENQMKRTMQETFQEFLICGTKAKEMTSPFIKFIVKVQVNEQSENSNYGTLYTVIDFTYTLLPSRVSLGQLKNEALKSGYYGTYIFSEKKKKTKDGEDISSKPTIESKAVSKDENNNVTKKINPILKPLFRNVSDKKSALLTPMLTSLINDKRMGYLVNNIFQNHAYFHAVGIFGDELLKMDSKDISYVNIFGRNNSTTVLAKQIETFSEVRFLEVIESIAWKIRFTQEMKRFIIEKNRDVFENLKSNFHLNVESLIGKMNIIYQSTELYHRLLEVKSNPKLGDTCLREDPKSTWSSDVIAFLELDSKKPSPHITIGEYTPEKSLNNYHFISTSDTFSKELQLINLLKKFSDKISIYDIRCDDQQSENCEYLTSIAELRKEFRSFLIVTCCKRRVGFLEITVPILKGRVMSIETVKDFYIDKKECIIIDRAHLLSSTSFLEMLKVLSEKNKIIQKIALFGNSKLFCSQEGQLFRDLFLSRKFSTHVIAQNINYEKIINNYDDYGNLLGYIRTRRNESSSKKLIVEIVCNNFEEKKHIINNFAKDFGLQDNQVISLADIDIGTKTIISDVCIYWMTEKTTKYHIAKLFDVASIYKRTIIYKSKPNFDIENPPAKFPYKKTSFTHFLEDKWLSI